MSLILSESVQSDLESYFYLGTRKVNFIPRYVYSNNGY